MIMMIHSLDTNNGNTNGVHVSGYTDRQTDRVIAAIFHTTTLQAHHILCIPYMYEASSRIV